MTNPVLGIWSLCQGLASHCEWFCIPFEVLEAAKLPPTPTSRCLHFSWMGGILVREDPNPAISDFDLHLFCQPTCLWKLPVEYRLYSHPTVVTSVFVKSRREGRG